MELVQQDVRNVCLETTAQNVFRLIFWMFLYFVCHANPTVSNAQVQILATRVWLVTIWTARHANHANQFSVTALPVLMQTLAIPAQLEHTSTQCLKNAHYVPVIV